MRKNKFVNPLAKRSQSSCEYQEKNQQQKSLALIQDKIYFPDDKLLPYRIQIGYQKKRKSDFINSNLYAITQRVNHKQKKSKQIRLPRENKFQVSRDASNNSRGSDDKEFVKYNTLQLRNLPGISVTASGSTIYRSKNIKSLGRLLIQHKIAKRGKSQLKRNMSVRDDESLQKSIQKSKSNKQSTLRLNQKNAKLYQTYFSSRKNMPTSNLRPLGKKDQLEQAKQFIQNPQNVLCRQIIQRLLYSGSSDNQQQILF